MVQVRENLTQLEGTVVGRSPHPTLPDFEVVDLHVEQASPVEGKPDLVHASPGTVLPVVVRKELAERVGESTRVRFRAARTSSGEVMAEPHPAPQDFSVSG
jgi:hypothetical protein